MKKYQTIQKVAEDIGIDTSHIRKMIRKKLLTSHKIAGFKRIYIDIEEFNALVKPIDDSIVNIDLDDFLV